MGIQGAFFQASGQHVFTEIMRCVRRVHFLIQHFIKIICVKHINAHRCQGNIRFAHHGWRIFRFLHEIFYFQVFIHRHHPEFAGLGTRHFDTADGTSCAAVDVVQQHLAVILFIYMVAGQNQNIFRLIVVADNRHILIHRVRRTAIPSGIVDLLAGRQHIDKLPALLRQKRPAFLQMTQ